MTSQKEILDDLVGLGSGAVKSVDGININSADAHQLENDGTVEQLWAMKAMEHADIFFNLICSVDPKLLRLTPKDNEIYESFRKEFPEFNVNKISEESLKSPAAKEKWRPFCNKFDKDIEDFSFATLLRISCDDDYSEENTILVTRIQFFCIEIARNREGHNDAVKLKFKPKPRKSKIL